MKLTETGKAFALRECLELNTLCFTRDERAPDGIFTENFTEGEVFVVTRGGVIASFAIVIEKDGEKYLWAIATHPSRRGQGFAGDLLDEIEGWAMDEPARGIGLTTHRDNPAQKLYFDKGYRVTKVLKGYYQSGDGLFMRRKLL